MLFPVERAFVGRNEKRAPLKTPAWEAIYSYLAINDILELYNISPIIKRL